MTKSELKIRAIENGTVIDHITANKALHILKILGLPDGDTKNITIAMNVSSAEIGRKDILKIENRELEFFITSKCNHKCIMCPQKLDIDPIDNDLIVQQVIDNLDYDVFVLEVTII